jgi:hypothetical protein
MHKSNLIAVFIFYNISSGVQAKLAFSKEFRHCNIITYDGKDWIMLDFDRTGLLTRKVYCKDGESLLKRLPMLKEISATISISVQDRVKTAWKPWWVRSCNEICRYASGADIGFTFNPSSLYKKLLKYTHKRNYEVLSHWRRATWDYSEATTINHNHQKPIN